MEIGISLSLTAPRTQGGGVVGPFPAPNGYRWQAVYYGTEPAYYGTQQEVYLERIAA